MGQDVIVECKWTKRHADVLDEFLNQLRKNKVEYFILRNFEGLPEKNYSKDVDLIIKPGKYREAYELLLIVFSQFEIPNYYIMKYEKVRCWFGIDVSNGFSIHIDLIEGYLNKGFEIFPFDELYKNTKDYKNYKVLNESYDIVMLLYYKVIGCKELKEKYANKISAGYLENKLDIDDILKRTLGLNLANQVINALVTCDFKWIVEHASTLSKASKRIMFFTRPIYTLINIVSFFSEKVHKIVLTPKKYRKFIAVEAPDGTGKTTFINELCVILAKYFVTELSNMHIYHFRPSLLPNLGAVGEKTGVMKQDTDFIDPHRNKPANQLSSFIRMVYYWIDYLIGGMICIRKDVQFGKFSIFDRYIYDFIVDPHRSRINLPRCIRVFFAKIVPSPEIVFVLKTDPNIIYNRKQELTIDEIERQLREFSRLKKIGKKVVEIDAAQNPTDMAIEAAEFIVQQYTFTVGENNGCKKKNIS